MSRAEHLPEIRRLRDEEGLLFREIADRLGLGISTVHGYYNDPDGSKEWKRKHRVNCAVCDAPVWTGDADWGGLCVPCRAADPETRRANSGNGKQRYSDVDCIAALQREAARIGRTPAANDWDGRNLLPTSQVMCRRFGSWNKAVIAAGLPLNATWRKDNDPIYPDEYLVENLREFARVFPTARIADYEEWAKDNHRPSAGIVRIRFGGWFRALDAAGVAPQAVAA